MFFFCLSAGQTCCADSACSCFVSAGPPSLLVMRSRTDRSSDGPKWCARSIGNNGTSLFLHYFNTHTDTHETHMNTQFTTQQVQYDSSCSIVALRGGGAVVGSPATGPTVLSVAMKLNPKVMTLFYHTCINLIFTGFI